MNTRVSHESLMDQLRGTPVWNALTNKDFELAKKLIEDDEESK